eukprot:2937566-Amphidinium_carterae.2
MTYPSQAKKQARHVLSHIHNKKSTRELDSVSRESKTKSYPATAQNILWQQCRPSFTTIDHCLFHVCNKHFLDAPLKLHYPVGLPCSLLCLHFHSGLSRTSLNASDQDYTCVCVRIPGSN